MSTHADTHEGHDYDHGDGDGDGHEQHHHGIGGHHFGSRPSIRHQAAPGTAPANWSVS
jgi:hypothetical protein